MCSFMKGISPKPRRILFLGAKPLLTSPTLGTEPRCHPGFHLALGRCVEGMTDNLPFHPKSTPQSAKHVGTSTWLISFRPWRPPDTATKGINQWEALNKKVPWVTKDSSSALSRTTVGQRKEARKLYEESAECMNIHMNPFTCTISYKFNETHPCKTMCHTDTHLSRGKWGEV